MVAFVILVLADLIAGLALFTFVAFLEIVPFGGPALSFSKALGLLLALSWLTVATTSRSVSFDPRVVRPVAYLLVLLLAWVMLSITWAESPAAALNALSRYALNAMLFVIVVSSVRERSALIKLLAAFVAGAAFAAMYGLANPGELAGRIRQARERRARPERARRGARAGLRALPVCRRGAAREPHLAAGVRGGRRDVRNDDRAHGVARRADRADRRPRGQL